MKLPNAKEMRNRNIIGERMRRARLTFDPPLTQDQLSGRLAAKGITLDRVAITKIENGMRCVFDYEIPGIADVLKVDVRWLLTGKK
ncbi:MAG: XRE family transcriptional regulator [Verrucomicrobiota bacterium]